MKTNKLVLAAALGLLAVACAPKSQQAEAQTAAGTEAVKKVDANDYLPSKALKDTVSYLLGINFGSMIKSYDFGDVNYSQLVKGMKDFINAKGNQAAPEFVDQFKINPDLMNTIFDSYLSDRARYKEIVNSEKEEAFLKANLKKEGMVETASGLQFRVADPGNDNKPADFDTVWVRYKGTLLDGTVFDECTEDMEPVSFPLNRVIRGWSEGMKQIGEGGKIELYIPSSLGYGAQGTRGIEPYSTLIFNVELIKVGHTEVFDSAE
ncbi:MAG: FKBP-type peptidyl-prolyl cis-trans isomerase [Bacteroidales bacterium]|nr:FKBP-type peptidyl-prolyl cis-trans isomerase [Bacteroidales bacterium]